MIRLARARLRARQVLALAFVAATFVGISGSAQAAQTCFKTSGNPLLAGFANGITPGASGECFINVGNANLSTQTPAFAGTGFPNFYAGYVQVTAGSIIVPAGDVIGGIGTLQLAPAAVQAQIAAFNLAHGLPAVFSDPFTGVEVFQSSLSGQVINQGTITDPPLEFGINNSLTGPTLEGIWVSATTFTGASTGVVNSGLIAVNQGNPGPLNIVPFNGPLTVTGIRIDPVAGNSWAVLNTNAITADSNYTGSAAVASAGGIGIQVTAPAVGQATGGVTNTGSIEASGTSFNSFPQTFGIQVGGATVSVGGGAAGPNGGTLIGDITNSGSVTVTATGVTNGNAGAGASGIRLNLATAGIGGSPGTFNGNIVNSGTVTVSANGAGLFAHGIEVGTSTVNAGSMSGGILNSGALTATGTNGATGVGINVISAVGGGIINTGTLTGSTAAIDLTQEVGGATTVNQNAGAITGAVKLSPTNADILNITGGMVSSVITGGTATTLNITGGRLNVADASASSVGTFKMTGGTLNFNVTPSTATHATITSANAATVGGTFNVIEAAGTYARTQTYINVFVAPSTSGTFTVTSAAPTLKASLVPGTAGGDLSLVLNFIGLTNFQTPNQTATAGGLNAMLSGTLSSPRTTLANALGGLTTAQQPGALDLLSGEIFATLPGVLAVESGLTRNAILGRLRQAGYAGAPDGLGALGFAGPVTLADPSETDSETELADAKNAAGRADAKAVPFPGKAEAPPAPSRDVTFWTQGFGNWGSTDSDGNAAAVKRTDGGFLSGVDARFGGTWLLGIAGGYMQSNADIDDRGASSGRIESPQIAAYAGGTLGPLNLRAGAAHAWHSIDTSRAVTLPGLVDVNHASFHGDTSQVFAEVGHGMSVGRFAVEPFAGLAFVHVGTGGAAEAGGASALLASDTHEDLGYSSLGVRAATEIPLANGPVLVPRASVAWQNAFHDVRPAANLLFQAGGTPFTLQGAPVARNSALIETGLDARLSPHARVGISYSGEIANSARDNAVKGTFTWNF